MNKIKEKQAPLCACGCNRFTKWDKKRNRWNKFINGHNFKGKQHTIETREKQSKAKIGNQNLKGYKHTAKALKAMSESQSITMIGNQNAKGTKHTEEYCKNLSKRMMGKQYAKGCTYKLTLETRKKMSAAKKGPKHPNWQDGISCEPYCEIWTDEEYKESIRERDSHTCQNPACWENCNHLTLCVHHIDEDKKNCHPWNLISVCRGCNARAEINREYWIGLYQGIMTEKYGYSYKKAA